MQIKNKLKPISVLLILFMGGVILFFILGVEYHIRLEVDSVSELVYALKIARLASKNHIFDIYIDEGTYDIWPILDKKYLTGPDSTYHRGLEVPDYCNLIGVGNVNLVLSIPEDENSEEHPYSYIVSTINLHNGENIIKNLTIVCNNGKYCVHDDSGGQHVNRSLLIENCKFVHSGMESDNYWKGAECYGAGYVTGRKATFKDCVFSGSAISAIYVHTQHEETMKTPGYLYIDNCAFVDSFVRTIDLQVPWDCENTLVVNINNCFFTAGCSIYTRGVAPIEMFGGGNTSVEFINDNKSTNYCVGLD